MNESAAPKRLPLEIWSRSLSYLAYVSVNQNKDILSCSLVCKAWNDIADLALHQVIHIQSSDHLNRFYKHVICLGPKQNPGHKIRALTCNISHTALHQLKVDKQVELWNQLISLLLHMPNLHSFESTLSAKMMLLTALIAVAGRSITSLSVVMTEDDQAYILQIHRFRCLNKLRILFATSVTFLGLSALSLPNVRHAHLTFTNVIRNSAADFLLGWHFPNVKLLHLTYPQLGIPHGHRLKKMLSSSPDAHYQLVLSLRDDVIAEISPTVCTHALSLEFSDKLSLQHKNLRTFFTSRPAWPQPTASNSLKNVTIRTKADGNDSAHLCASLTQLEEVMRKQPYPLVIHIHLLPDTMLSCWTCAGRSAEHARFVGVLFGFAIALERVGVQIVDVEGRTAGLSYVGERSG